MYVDGTTDEAPELAVSEWFNTDAALSLAGLRGRPVLIHAFQMLCPGCVAHAIPQTQKVQAVFAKTDLQVLGLHTVFEHHDAMTPVALKAFLHEYRINFPVGVDQPSSQGGMPETMAAYGMQGTPTTILIDRAGMVAANMFGQIEDLALGALLQDLLSRGDAVVGGSSAKETKEISEICDDQGCPTPA